MYLIRHQSNYIPTHRWYGKRLYIPRRHGRLLFGIKQV